MSDPLVYALLEQKYGKDGADEITALRQQLEQAQAKAENCEREARQWRQEARTQSATVAEIYQELTGRTGEPGNWNGARPLKPAILRKQAEAITKASNEAHNKLFEQAMLSRDSGEAISAFMDYAQRLRQQADELEAKTAGGEQ